MYRTYYHATQPVTGSIVNNEEDVRNEDSSVKLPELEIYTFRGGCTKWQSCIDSFKVAIDPSPTLSNTDKFNYLRCYVAGEALNTIEGLSLTNGNYVKALELLEDRYGNKQAIITAHTKNLLKL